MSGVDPAPRRHAPLAMGAALLCAVWLLGSAWGAAQYRQATHRGPVLYAPMSVAVDASDGTVYVASGAGRVHKYGPDGDGRGAFVVDTDGASFRLSAEAPGRLALAREGDAEVVVFDEGGRLVAERRDPDAYARFGADEAKRASGSEPAVLLEDGAIVERTSEGSRVLVPALPFPLSWFAVAPWTLVLSLFLSTLGLMAAFVWPFLARPGSTGVR
jgi:hypothetical protein